MMVQGICMLHVGPGVLACGSWCVVILVLCWYVDPGMLASWFRGITMLACWSFCVDIWVLWPPEVQGYRDIHGMTIALYSSIT